MSGAKIIALVTDEVIQPESFAGYDNYQYPDAPDSYDNADSDDSDSELE